MLQSQFNLDHRLAELRELGVELRQAQAAARGSNRTARSLGAAVRSLFGGAPASSRPAGLAAA